MMHDDEKNSISDALREARRDGLSVFVEEFISLLAQEKFSLADLLQAIASWLYRTKGNVEVIKHLEDAVIKLSPIQGKE
ncbi:hypothetical protein H6G96_37490 [Nostoc sp. FACHB-892]|uniref:hypothetical protein n=1 Tax=Nostoc sp. FACHB-892 TaxID=2692843 RepID=UPI0016858ACA|nr:hypothetical protein [Nostoc sp. FACHB-892]MBD2731819.1 hypothetical protein [Nostoc sp. FACHB-892]